MKNPDAEIDKEFTRLYDDITYYCHHCHCVEVDEEYSLCSRCEERLEEEIKE